MEAGLVVGSLNLESRIFYCYSLWMLFNSELFSNKENLYKTTKENYDYQKYTL